MASVLDPVSIDPAVAASGLINQLIEGLEAKELEREEALQLLSQIRSALHEQASAIKNAGG